MPQRIDKTFFSGLDEESKKPANQIVVVIVTINPSLATAGNLGQMLPRALAPLFKSG